MIPTCNRTLKEKSRNGWMRKSAQFAKSAACRDDSITEEVRIAVPFEMTEAECVFFEAYCKLAAVPPAFKLAGPAIIASVLPKFACVFCTALRLQKTRPCP